MHPKTAIAKVVNTYLALYPREFILFHEGIKAFRRTLADEDNATVEAGEHAMTRALYQMPETLHTMLIHKLSEEEMKWLTTIEGGRWFANKFPAFRLGRNKA